MPTDKRLGWIDYARGLAIILVVYRHAFEGLKRTTQLTAAGVHMQDYLYLEKANILFFSFRMPLFFIVSGVFISGSLAKRGFASFFGNKTRTILYPYFLWGFIQIALQIVFSAYANSDKSWDHLLFLFYQPREVEQFWYLLALFNVSVIYAAFRSFTKLKPHQHLSIGLLLYLVSALFAQYKIEAGFISDIFHYYVYLALGDVLSRTIRSSEWSEKLASWKTTLLLLLPFIVAQYAFLVINMNMNHVVGKYLYVEYHLPFLYLLISLTGCLFIVSLSAVLDRYNMLRWLRYTGRHSLYIYVMHVIVFAGFRVMLIRIFHVTDIRLLLFGCIVAGVSIPLLFYKFCEKRGLQFLFTLEKKNTGA